MRRDKLTYARGSESTARRDGADARLARPSSRADAAEAAVTRPIHPRLHALALGRRSAADALAGVRGMALYRMITGVPAEASGNSLSISAFASRMQPWDAARPRSCGWSVPWSAIGPPCTQLRRTSE